MTDSLRVCDCGGYLVSSVLRVGVPFEVQFDGLNDLVGCSRLRCAICGADVRNLVARLPRPEIPPATLHESQRVDELSEPNANEEARLYYCRCLYWLETSQTCTTPTGSGDVLEPVLPWSCSGHPTVAAVDGADQLALAAGILTYGATPVVGRTVNVDPLLQLWRASDATLRSQLRSLVAASLRTAHGAHLARALAIAALDPGDFRDVLSAFTVEDPRLSEADPTRSGWFLRDRLANTIACAAQRPGWGAFRNLARALLPETSSRLLMRAMMQREPTLVEDTLTKLKSAIGSNTEPSIWRTKLQESTASTSAGHAGKALLRFAETLSAPDAAIAALQRALDDNLQSWRGSFDDPTTVRLLEAIESLQPSRGFDRCLEVLEGATDPRIRLSALRALEVYFAAPPREPSPAFKHYIALLNDQINDPLCGSEALRILARLGHLDVASKAHEIVRNTPVLEALLAFFLTSTRATQAVEALSALYDACLETRDAQIQAHFLTTASHLGWALSEDFGASPTLEGPGARTIELSISDVNREFLMTLQVSRVLSPNWLSRFRNARMPEGSA